MGDRTMRSVLAVAVLTAAVVTGCGEDAQRAAPATTRAAASESSAASTSVASGSSTSAPTDAPEATTLVTDDNGDPMGLELCDDIAENAVAVDEAGMEALREVQDDVKQLMGHDGAVPSINGVGLDPLSNRVTVFVGDPSTADLVVLQRELADEPVCFHLGLAPADRPQPGDELGVIPSRDPDGSVPADTLVTCGSAIPFPLSTLDDPVMLEGLGDDALVAALADWRTNFEGRHLPEKGWFVLTYDDRQAEIVATTGRGGVAFVAFEASTDGWEWAGSAEPGKCGLRVALPEGFGEVDWRLDRRHGEPQPGDTTIHVRASERDCASGEAMGDRLLGPEIVETDDAVLISFAAIAQYTDQECPDNPWAPVDVRLSEPLGDRALRDGLVVGDLARLVG